MKRCKCKSDFRINNSSISLSYSFSKDEWFQYYTEIHQGTGLLIYFVIKDNTNISQLFKGFPFVESKFLDKFDNTQEVREQKINIILNN